MSQLIEVMTKKNTLNNSRSSAGRKMPQLSRSQNVTAQCVMESEGRPSGQEGAAVESGRPGDLLVPVDFRRRGGGRKKEAPNFQSTDICVPTPVLRA